MKDKVALVGTASTEMEAPFNDPDFDIWVLNWNIERYPRVDLGFEIHETRGGAAVEEVEYKDGRGQLIPCVRQNNYPYDKLEGLPPPFNTGTYFKSSLDYMLCKAILDGYSYIGIYGVDMALSDDEYFRQQPSLHAWMGLAMGRGIEVFVPDASPLLKSTYTYGRTVSTVCPKPFTQKDFLDDASRHKTVIDELNQEIADLQRQIQDKTYSIHAHGGSLQYAERMGKIARAIESGQKIDNLVDTAKLTK